MAGWIKMALGVDVGLSSGDFLLDGDPPPPRKAGRAPAQFSGNFYCAQTVRCMTMPLGKEVGLSPGEFVLDGDPAPLPKKGAEPPPEF